MARQGLARRDLAGHGLALLADLEKAGAISEIGLHLSDPNLTYERYESIGHLLGRMHQSLRFAIGDWLLLGEQLFPQEVAQAAEALALSPAGMLEYLRVSDRVPRSVRRRELSWSHHRAIASLEIPEQKKWLKTASEKRLSHHELREALREGKPPEVPTVCRCCGRKLDG